MQILGVIPARFASSRFPGKPLAMIAGKTMINHVYSQAKKAASLFDVLVATDDIRIYDEVERFGGKAVMTNPNHATGTERCLEAVQKFPHTVDAVINIQGDEPLIAPEQIEQLAFLLQQGHSIASLAKQIHDLAELLNPNVVKVVFAKNGNALLFSRQAIPFQRNEKTDNWLDLHAYYKHVGLYGYHVETLQKICALQASSLEQAESLEQLRWLENGLTIAMGITQRDAHGVDTPEDIKKIENLF